MKRLLAAELGRAALLIEQLQKLENEKVEKGHYQCEVSKIECEAKQVLKAIRKHSVQWEKSTKWGYEGEFK